MSEIELIHKRMAMIFNEWARRYAANPDEFADILGPDGKAIEDYGERATSYFHRIANEMDDKGQLPRSQRVAEPVPT